MKRALAKEVLEVDEPEVKHARITYSNAFKFLAPDSLASEMIGPKGATIQEMQDNSDSRISISDRGDLYQDTGLRLVLVRAQSQRSIDLALKDVVSKMHLVIERVDDHDVVSKEGKLKIKVVVPKKAAAIIIGTGGSNSKAIAETTNCRLRVEEIVGRKKDDTAEQLISIVGPGEGMPKCITKINSYVQECSSEAYFQDWARFSSSKTTGGHFKGKGKGKPTMSGPIGSGNYGVSTSPDDAGVLKRVMHQMPKHLTDQQTFALQASLPLDYMSALIGKGGSGTKEIKNATGANVTFRNDEPNCTVLVEGPLHCAVAAYMMVMQRFLEIDNPEVEKKPTKGKGKSRGKGSQGKATVGIN